MEYGKPDTQARQLNVNCLHDVGYTGSGIYLAVIDAGFNGMDTIPYFDSVFQQGRLLDTFDFINGGSVYNYSGHGTAVSSCIVAERYGTEQFIGTAKDVDLALYVSEDVSSETQLEEFFLVEALERCDSVGVEIANISLGYKNFDDSLTNHTYEDLDGQTTIAAIGATVAASKGIIVVTSAGNAGPDKIGTPADADSILTVGAIDGLGNWAWFSSTGPSFDGRVKPDVAARGGQAWVVFENGTAGQGNGTSFSSPVMAGAVACLVQANPSLTAQEIIQTVRESGHQFTTPDTLLGYGIPDFCFLNASVENVGNEFVWDIYPNPASESVMIAWEETAAIEQLSIVDQMGRIVMQQTVKGNSELLELTALEHGVYQVLIQNQHGRIIGRKRLLIAQ